MHVTQMHLREEKTDRSYCTRPRRKLHQMGKANRSPILFDKLVAFVANSWDDEHDPLYPYKPCLHKSERSYCKCCKLAAPHLTSASPPEWRPRSDLPATWRSLHVLRRADSIESPDSSKATCGRGQCSKNGIDQLCRDYASS